MILTCYEVGSVPAELVLGPEVHVAEGHEGEDGGVVADADEADQPEARRKYEDVPDTNLERVTASKTVGSSRRHLDVAVLQR